MSQIDRSHHLINPYEIAEAQSGSTALPDSARVAGRALMVGALGLGAMASVTGTSSAKTVAGPPPVTTPLVEDLTLAEVHYEKYGRMPAREELGMIPLPADHPEFTQPRLAPHTGYNVDRLDDLDVDPEGGGTGPQVGNGPDPQRQETHVDHKKHEPSVASWRSSGTFKQHRFTDEFGDFDWDRCFAELRCAKSTSVGDDSDPIEEALSPDANLETSTNIEELDETEAEVVEHASATVPSSADPTPEDLGGILISADDFAFEQRRADLDTIHYHPVTGGTELPEIDTPSAATSDEDDNGGDTQVGNEGLDESLTTTVPGPSGLEGDGDTVPEGVEAKLDPDRLRIHFDEKGDFRPLTPDELGVVVVKTAGGGTTWIDKNEYERAVNDDVTEWWESDRSTAELFGPFDPESWDLVEVLEETEAEVVEDGSASPTR